MLELLLYKIKAYTSLAACSLLPSIACATASDSPQKLNITLPPNFEISTFAKLEDAPRMMAFDKNGALFVSLSKSDQIFMLPDANKDGLSEAPVLISKAFLSRNHSFRACRAADILIKPLNLAQIIFCISTWDQAAMCVWKMTPCARRYSDIR